PTRPSQRGKGGGGHKPLVNSYFDFWGFFGSPSEFELFGFPSASAAMYASRGFAIALYWAVFTMARPKRVPAFVRSSLNFVSRASCFSLGRSSSFSFFARSLIS